MSSRVSNKPRPSILKQSCNLKKFQSIRSTSSSSAAPTAQSPSSLSSLHDGSRSEDQSARYFPEASDKVVAYWLLGSAASVFGLVVLGGLTRLTESG